MARDFATAKSGMIFWGMGVSQHIHGTDNSRCLISLALMCGQVGRPGTGLHPLRGQNNVQGASDAGLIPMFLPDYQTVTDDSIRGAFTGVWGSEDFSAEKGLTVTEIVDAIHSDDIKAMYILGENPAMSDPDVEHARDAFAKLDHLVVQDIFITETANYADVILPASTLYEKSGTVSNTNRQVQMVRPAVAPPGEAKEDWWIEVETGQALRAGLEARASIGCLCRDGDQHALAGQHHLGAAGENRRDLSEPQPRRSRPGGLCLAMASRGLRAGQSSRPHR